MIPKQSEIFLSKRKENSSTAVELASKNKHRKLSMLRLLRIVNSMRSLVLLFRQLEFFTSFGGGKKICKRYWLLVYLLVQCWFRKVECQGGILCKKISVENQRGNALSVVWACPVPVTDYLEVFCFFFKNNVFLLISRRGHRYLPFVSVSAG